MLEAERHRLILKLLQERSIISITELVEIVGASDATIRRDVTALAEGGQLRRVRGGAEAVHPRHEAHLVGVPFALSREVAVPQKRAIARAAAALIQDGEAISINGGTTTAALVEFLAARELDILTNSIPIITQLLATSRNRVCVPGGTIFREQNIVLSPFDNDSIATFSAQKLFTGCFGLNRHGLMEADPLIAQAQAKLLKAAEQVIVMADSRKLKARSSIIVMPPERIATLVTDDGAREEDLKPLRAAGVQVIIAPVGAAEKRA
jgi:DeoR family ulaG and ulaABCDEF operon transcriptional repressor